MALPRACTAGCRCARCLRRVLSVQTTAHLLAAAGRKASTVAALRPCVSSCRCEMCRRRGVRPFGSATVNDKTQEVRVLQKRMQACVELASFYCKDPRFEVAMVYLHRADVPAVWQIDRVNELFVAAREEIDYAQVWRNGELSSRCLTRARCR